MKLNKAMILAAGEGTRLRPLTNAVPKPLVKVNEHTLIDYALNLLNRLKFKEVKINTHYRKEDIKKFLNNKNYNFNIDLIEEKNLLDTGGGIFNATSSYDQEPFLVLNPDTIWGRDYDQEIEKMTQSYFENNLPILLLVNKKISYDKSFKGDFNLDAKNIVRRDTTNNEYIYTGAQILTRANFSNIKEKIFSMNIIWDQLIKNNQLLGFESKNIFYHINSVKSYEEVLKLKVKY